MNSFRAAEQIDASFLVPLVAESSGGVWPAVWKAFAQNGESVEKAGARYLANPENNLSVDNTILVESNGIRIGAMISYRENPVVGKSDESRARSPLPRDLFDALQPYRELSDPNSLFISELCLLSEARGQGLGTRLLEHARESAAEQSLPRVTLRVFSANTGAVRLYERFGFRQISELPILPHPDIQVAGSVILMSHSL